MVRYRYLTITLLYFSTFFQFLFSGNLYAMTTGSIAGLVHTGEGVVIPGATVLLRQKNRISRERKVVTDSSGRFRFNGLEPGLYELHINEPAFSVVSESLYIIADRTVYKDIVLAPLGESFELIVGAQATTNSVTPPGHVVTGETLSTTPLENNRYQDGLEAIPDVTRTADGGFHALGSRNRQVAFLIDGENTTDPVTGTFGFNIPMDAIGSMEVKTFGFSAEYGQAQGAVVNLITDIASDEWTGSFFSFAPVMDYDGYRMMGIQSWNPGYQISGPLVAGRLGVNHSLEYRYGVTRIKELPPDENKSYRRGIDAFIGFHSPLTDRLSMKFTAITFPLDIDYRYIDFNRPKETTVDYRQDGLALTTILTSVLSARMTLETRLKYHHIYLASFPQGDDPYEIHPDSARGNYYNQQRRTSDRYSLGFVLSRTMELFGEHELRGGLMSERTEYYQQYRNNPVFFYDSDNFLYQKNEYSTAVSFARKRWHYGGFIQDNWQLLDSFSAYLGVRSDYDSIFENFNLSPRIGFLWRPLFLQKTALRGGWGRFFDEIPLAVAAYEEYPQSFISRWDSDTGMLLDDRLQVLKYLDRNLKTPFSEQWYVQWDQEWTSETATYLRYVRKKGYRELQDISILKPRINQTFEDELILTNANRSEYWGLTVGAEFKPREKVDLSLYYTWSSSYGNGSDWESSEGNSPDPIKRKSEWAPLPWDSPHRTGMTARIPLFYSMISTLRLEYRTGYPYSIYDQNQERVGEKNDKRFPDYFRMDLLVQKILPFTKKFEVKAQAGIINLTNHFNPESVQNNQDAENFGQFYNSDEISLQVQLRLIPRKDQ